MNSKTLILRVAGALFFCALACACANIGNPSGGPRDEDPPIFTGSSPAPGSLNVSGEKVTLNFNEIVNVKDPLQKVVVSPVSRKMPRISSMGKRITVQFDSLEENATYTIDFGDAIEDNNENNKLQGFAYTFSTGPTLDSLRISGRVLGARDLEPQQGMLVGVTRNLHDSAFMKLPLLRVARTDDRGRFVIRGLAPGEYRVYALSDRDNDFVYSTPEEDIAFYPLAVTPSTQAALAYDSVFDNKTGVLDTVLRRPRTIFLPNDILLRSFNSGKRNQYLAKYQRQDTTRVFLKFNAPSKLLPEISVVGEGDGREGPIGQLEASEKLDSLVYWLRPGLMRTDSLTLAVRYQRTDSLGKLAGVCDTLKFFHRRIPVKKKKGREEKISAADSLAAITFKWNFPSGAQEVWRPFEFETPLPLAFLDTTKIRLMAQVDSVYRPVNPRPLISRRDSLSPRHLKVEFPWAYDTKYRLDIDTLAAMDIYGKVSLPAQQEFSTKKMEDYCSMTFRLTGLDPGVPAFVELLDGSDALVRAVPVTDGTAYFPFLTPGKYYARVIEDFNGNGEYDSGDYELNLQPEVAYYYPKAVNLKKNWDKEEEWDVFATAIDLQKPAAVTRNKPAQDKRRRDRNKETGADEEDEEELFDPTRNPFDPNDRGRRRSTSGSY